MGVVKKILLIDDDITVLDSLTQLLQLTGYDVIAADNAEEGISRAQREYPDLIICDVMMKGLNGYNVLAKLRLEPLTATIPVFFISAHSDANSMLKAHQLGADYYLTKPFSSDTLLRTIQTHFTQP